MAIEKQMTPFEVDEALDDVQGEAVQVEIVNPEAVSMETEDGGIIIDFEGEITEELLGGEGHDQNLAEVIDEDVLQSMASELVADFKADQESRSDWARAYVKVLDLLGMKVEDRQQPWAGLLGFFTQYSRKLSSVSKHRLWGRSFLLQGQCVPRLLVKTTLKRKIRHFV